MTQDTEIFDIVDHGKWEATPDNEKFFSSNHVIDAYLKGKKDGIKDEKDLISDKVKANISVSSDVTKEVFSKMRSSGFSPISAYLRIPDWSIYEILVTIPEKEFLDDKILDVYNTIANIEDHFKNDYYSLNISLCDIGPNFSEKCLAVEGYGLKYAE